MINQFKLKEIFAMVIPQFVTLVAFMIMFISYGFMIASIGSAMVMVLTTFIGIRLIKNPFSDMLKGNGLLTLNIDSKGLISPSISSFNGKEIEFNHMGLNSKAEFDRNVVFNLDYPDDNPGGLYDDKNGNIYLKVNKDDFNKQRFGLYHFPCLIYNTQMGSFLTKDWLSEKESETFSRHHIIHANKVAEQLVEQITNFSRYIADNAVKKASTFLGNPIVRYLIIGLIIFGIGFMAIKFLPDLTSKFNSVVKP